MIRNMFKADADRRALAELKLMGGFKLLISKLDAAREAAYRDVLACDPDDLEDRRAYLRALDDLISNFNL